MRSLRRVTRAPMGMPLRSLKLLMSFLETVGTAFRPAMELISTTAFSTIFLSPTALPKPWFRLILSRRGTSMGLL